MNTVYEQQDAAFRHISAFAILKDGKHVANITLKHGNAVTAYVHWIGLQMTRGQARGGGYDRASAAIANAAAKLGGYAKDLGAFLVALDDAPQGNGWARNIEAQGFTICNVI